MIGLRENLHYKQIFVITKLRYNQVWLYIVAGLKTFHCI